MSTFSGIPEKIQVVLGAQFQDVLGFDEGDVVILTKHYDLVTDKYYSEDGTSTANLTTNRINVRLIVASGNNNGAITLQLADTGSYGVSFTNRAGINNIGTADAFYDNVYTFLDIARTPSRAEYHDFNKTNSFFVSDFATATKMFGDGAKAIFKSFAAAPVGLIKSGFPDEITVIPGQKLDGIYGLAVGVPINLQRISPDPSGTEIAYSVDGTNTGNQSTNQLKLGMAANSAGTTGSIRLELPFQTGSNFDSAALLGNFSGGAFTDNAYTFLDIARTDGTAGNKYQDFVQDFFSVFWSGVTGAVEMFGNGANSLIQSVAVTSADSTPPTWTATYPKENTVGGSSATIDVAINEGGTAYGVVIPDTDPEPSAQQIIDGEDSTGTPVASGFSANVALPTPDTSDVLSFTNLSETTAYDVWCVAEDDEGTPNKMTSGSKVDITTLDQTGPTWTSAPTTVKVRVPIYLTPSETGNAYFVVVADGAGAPSSAQVKAGQDSGGSSALASGSTTTTAGTEALMSVRLTKGSNYDVYVVAEDGIPNLQDAPTKLDVNLE